MSRAALLLVPPILLAFWSVVASFVTLWGLGTLEAVGWPSWHWWGYLSATMPDAHTQRLVNQWLLIGAGVGSAAAGMLGYRIVSDGRSLLGFADRPLHGRSKFATRREGQGAGLVYSRAPRPDALLLGRTKGLFGWFARYVCLPGVEHVMLFAKTGAGKGVAYVITNCFNYADSLVVLDIKGENHRTTAAHRRKRLKQEVYLFAPLAEDGRTHCWNPLGDISTAQPDYISKLQRRAFNIFPEVEGKDRFWQDGARSAFLGISVLVAESPELALNPATVFRFFTRGDGAAELARRIEARRAAGSPHSQTCVDLISDYLNGTDEVVKGIRKHVTATMGLWFNPKIAAATAKSDFSLRELRRRKMTVYVGVMPSDLEQLGVLLRLFFLQLFEANTDVMPDQDRTIRHRCHVLLDEFTSVPVMRAIAKATGFARGFWMHFSFVVQSKNQVREEYKGQGEASLLENVGAEIVFGTDDPTLCREASERAGYDTVDNVSRTTPRFFSFFRAKEQNESTSQTRRALLLPQEVARLPVDEEIVFRATVPPFLLKRLRWYEDRHFKRLIGRPPELPRVTYQLARDDGLIRLPGS
ncbi:type IV secretory system conjugative DNA transfer family protein (plasmid) [Skermanella rosea]|uniref:type IV secretory system conjugative DNA transfer family protein n=1 Tax=Skermanella rosea TaxID=1817965 RepID=UPI001932F8E6|nr:type IV secretory system conjugative DNA transfer family protein [Skermanella rosea]UEM08134.1 type IV secretory system conjugative DNA transfer family protein [Skermanella rosea]